MPKGRVMAFGTFDLLHPGHLFFLKQAKSLGKELVVVVARDKSVLFAKGKKPFFSEKDRLEIIGSIRFVDKAVLGMDFEKDKIEIIRKFKPEVIALGYDQKPSEKELGKELEKDGLKARIVRLKPKNESVYKTSKIKSFFENKKS